MSTLNKGLYIVSTPIGNLEDISLRAVRVLEKSDFILCEDTRHSLKLLNHYKIKNKLIPYHKFNEKKSINKIIEYLNEGKILSLISDAGTPVLSDPGNFIINECIKKNHSIYTIPGPSSITAATSVSGFDDKFLFYGFLPKKESEIIKSLKKLKDLEFSIVFFIPAVRINFYIKFFKQFFLERKIFIAREMTKKYESYYRDNLKSIESFNKGLKGELTVIISKPISTTKLTTDFNKIEKQIVRYLKSYKVKDIVELISKKEEISKKIIYNLCLKHKR
jgi:16S rRNA (cytidine1402-2'-O)-methyltransferase